MKIISIDYSVDLSTLKAQYDQGYTEALDLYFVYCLQQEKEIPEWVLSGMYDRSQKAIEKDKQKKLKKYRYKSLVMAAVIAAKCSDFTPKVGKFTLAKLLLETTHAEQGEPFTIANIKKLYTRHKTEYESNNSDLQVNETAFEKFALRLKEIKVDVSNTPKEYLFAKLETEIQKKEITIPF